MRISGPRAVLAGTAAVVLTAVAVLVGLLVRHDAPAPSGTTSAGPRVVVAPAAGRVGVARAVAALAVLRDWDRARARAWADGDAGALRGLYVERSAAGEHDVAMLRAWLRRGLRVRDLEMQVLRVELRRQTERRIVLVVTDRLAGASATGRGRRVVLPRDGPSTRRLVFVRTGDRWLLGSAQDAASPVASTASTSGSANP
ncbi:hypothetical protein FHP29_10930 [Nocardioides albidus]|uniref:Uncharacterized protein n=1 Tax=Nocardioides albidus TaxID=1517589 RepID=A0A5C4VUE6_9ACTN|nr:hypothetical protein [Nocardioides albidus]TNM39421.1 hypothetical protein FHP29_10930 [Nocardioides albidus]